MADIFLSYSNKDRNRLRPLVEALLGSGLTVFWDRDIPPGSTWRSVLDRELRTAAWVIVIWSRSSVESEWVLEEAQDARTRRILLPASIDRIDPPIGFRAIQSADLKDWKGDATDPSLSAFVAAAVARVRGEAVPPAPASRAIRPRRWMAAAGVLLLLVSGALLLRGTIQGHAPTISPATDAGKPTQAADPRPLHRRQPVTGASSTRTSSKPRRFQPVSSWSDAEPAGKEAWLTASTACATAQARLAARISAPSRTWTGSNVRWTNPSRESK